ncbi:olfactory receptor class A-like protein 1 [Erpetoichthys calabaricus]|uniref:olfactory receptor class A-like protein 1 n=1 Tax=Erpetoichthys calabaricus TaxID=27687 RepID=UPI00223449ED|nr:olfactory receptor class A-like protein 1 [Erpetoichthys calabaricus]
MDSRQIFKAAGFVILTSIAIPANLLVCSTFLHSLLMDGKLLTTDIILCHLAFANLMVTFTRGIPQTLTAFGYRNLFDDIGCKLSLVCFRIFRGLSISLTCLLSAYQAIAVSPASSRLALLKLRIPQYLIHIITFLYVLWYALNADTVLYSVSTIVNNTVPPYTFNLQYCFVIYPDYIIFFIQGLISLFSDLTFILLMTVMSAYILLLLYFHSKKVKSIRSSDHKSGQTPETKASRAVVTLVILYNTFYGIDNAIWVYSLTVVRVVPLLSDIRVFFATLYTSVCPIVVTITNPKVKNKLKVIKPGRSTHVAEMVTSVS